MKDGRTDTDADAIEAVARDYAEGWYTGDAARMARALDAAFVKRTMARDSAGNWTIDRTRTRSAMVDMTRDGVGLEYEGEHVFDIRILDVFRDIATVRCLSAEYVDYLHLARLGADGWKIVNVLWQLREGEFQAGD